MSKPSTSFEPSLPVNTQEALEETSPESATEAQESETLQNPEAMERKRVAEQEETPEVAQKKRKPRIRKEKWEEYGAGSVISPFRVTICEV